MQPPTRAVEFAPDKHDAWLVLGWARYRSGDWPGSIDALGKSCELQDGGNEWQWFFLAMAHWRAGDANAAMKWYDKAARYVERVKPDADEPYRFRDEAEALMPPAKPRRLAIENAETQSALGRSFREKKKLSRAADAFRRATKLAPDRAEYRQTLGDILNHREQSGEAEAAYRKGIRLDNTEAGRQHDFGDILRAQGKTRRGGRSVPRKLLTFGRRQRHTITSRLPIVGRENWLRRRVPPERRSGWAQTSPSSTDSWGMFSVEKTKTPKRMLRCSRPKS